MLRVHLLSASSLLVLALVACSKVDPADTSTPATNDVIGGGDGGTTTKPKATATSRGEVEPGSSSGVIQLPDGGTVVLPDKSSLVKTSTESVTITNEVRHYILAVPKDLDANRKYPLIVALHGDGGNAQNFIGDSKLLTVTGSDAIVVFTDQVLDLFTSYNNNHDQRLVRAAIIDAETKTGAVDTTKIWGFGYSKGAFMLNEMACRKPGLFTAMAIHAGGAPQEQDDDGEVSCPSAEALPMFMTEGANDDPEGGAFMADFWAGLAGCNGSKSATTPSICKKYNGCDSAMSIDYCTIPNHGHSPLYSNAALDSWTWWNSLGK